MKMLAIIFFQQTFKTRSLDGNIDKIKVPDPLAVEDLISCKLNSKRKLAS